MGLNWKQPELFRKAVIGGLLAAWGLAILAGLIYTQIWKHAEYGELARKRQQKVAVIPAPRGLILDRNGEELAVNVKTERLVINPRFVKSSGDRFLAARTLGSAVGLPARELTRVIGEAQERKRGHLVIKDDLTLEEARRLRALKYDLVQIEEGSRRYYPKQDLASQVVGVTGYLVRQDAEGKEETYQTGTAGIEQQLDQVLRGVDGERWELRDVHGNAVFSSTRPPIPGTSVRLTLDSWIQHVAQEALKEAVESAKAESGSVLLMDPRSGEILAMASYPYFNPNRPPKTQKELERVLDARTNRAVMAPFEPGSVFKMITFAAAVESRLFRMEDVINCGSGSIVLGKRRIRDHHAYAALPFQDVFAKSSNVGTINVALRLGQSRMLDYVKRFGFGSWTGLPLPSESRGRVWEKWRPDTIGSVAIGHELTATSVQLARAVAVIANGGRLVQPKLLMEGETAGAAEESKQVIAPETAVTMRALMQRVVLSGTGRGAAIEGYSAGGKTGTAQIYDHRIRRYTHFYNSSFVGFAPAANPAMVASITIHGARVYGGTIAAPVFKKVMNEALIRMNVPPDAPEPETKELETPVLTPEETFLAQFEAVSVEGDEAEEAGEMEESPDEEVAVGPKTPDFSGMSRSAVLAYATATGFDVALNGRGLARRQSPPPGAVLPPGGRIEVQFTF